MALHPEVGLEVSNEEMWQTVLQVIQDKLKMALSTRERAQRVSKWGKEGIAAILMDHMCEKSLYRTSKHKKLFAFSLWKLQTVEKAPLTLQSVNST